MRSTNAAMLSALLTASAIVAAETETTAAGFLKNAFFDELELHATSIVTLDRDDTRMTGDTG